MRTSQPLHRGGADTRHNFAPTPSSQGKLFIVSSARHRRTRTILLVGCASSLALSGAACTAILGLRDDYVLASGDGGPGGSDTDVPPEDVDGGRDIQGSLTVHVPPLGADGIATWVFVNDGAAIAPQAVPGAAITFRDAALVGPQTVTLVQTYKRDADTWSEATTLRNVARNEIWFGEPTAPPEVTANANGRIASYDGGREVAFVATHGFRVGQRIPEVVDGAWSTTVEGSTSGTFRLVALEEPAEGGFLFSRRVGQSSSLSLSGLGGGDLEVGDVRLDTTFNESLEITLVGGGKYGSPATATATMHFFQEEPPRPSLFDQRSPFRPLSDAGTVLTVRSPLMSGIFSGWSRYALVQVTTTLAPVVSAAELWLQWPPLRTMQPLPDSPIVVEPSESLATIARGALQVVYSDVPAAAQLVAVDFVDRNEAPHPRFTWHVIAPRTTDGRDTFKPFTFPATVLPSTFAEGPCEITVSAFASQDGADARALLGARPGITSIRQLVPRTRIQAELSSTSLIVELTP